MSEVDRIIQTLNQRGWAVSDSAIPLPWWTGLLAQAQQSWDSGHFSPGEIGRSAAEASQPEARGDSICWIEPDSPQADLPFFDWMAQFRQVLNERFNMGLRSQEFHFARYAEGKGYLTHIDQHRGVNHRKISVLLYLNPDWDPVNGGELCLYDPRQFGTEIQRIAPLGGRLVVFASWLMPHAVLPCRHTRWSLAGWLRTDAPAALLRRRDQSE